MEAGAGEITTLSRTGWHNACFTPTSIPRVTTPPHKQGEAHFTPEVAASPTVLPSHAHGFISPLPAQRPARAPHRLSLRSGPPTPTPAFTISGAPGPAPCPGRAPARRRVPSATVAHWGEGRGGGRASASRPYTGLGEKRSHRSPGSGGSSLAFGQRNRTGASEGTAGCRAGWKSGKEGGGGRDAGSRLLSPPPPRLPQPGRAPSHTRPLSHSLAVCLDLPHPHSHTHSPPPPHTLTPGRSSLPRSLTPSLVCSARARDSAHTQRARRRRRPPRAPPDRGAARRPPACRGPSRAPAPPSRRRRGGQGVATGARGRASPRSSA